MARLRCQLLEILSLRATVALSKGMDIVHVADDAASLSRELSDA